MNLELTPKTVRRFCGLLLIYFVVQVVLRVLISSSLDLDESEQLVLTQKLSLGYGSQPPLYTWVQFGFFKVFGLSVFALSLFKNLLLFCTYLFTYLNARTITKSRACAVAAAASLLFIPQIAWESQRDLTHSVLASTFACITLYCFLRMTARPGNTLAYVLFGMCAGLGVLSKYNFALVLVALVLAAVSIPEFRPVIVDKRMGLAALIATVIVLPNAMWAAEHRDLALQSVSKFEMQNSGHWLPAVISGLKVLLVSSITFFGPFVLVYGLLFWRRSQSETSEKSESEKLVLRMLLFSYGLMVVVIVVLRITEIRDRWLQPVLISAPVLAIAFLKDRLDFVRFKWLLTFSAIVMACVTIGLHARIVLAEKWHRTQPWNRPYDALAQELKGAIGPDSTVITDTALLAGNLRANISGKIFTPPELAGLFAEDNTNFAIVWAAGGDPPRAGDAGSKKSGVHENRDLPPANVVAFERKMGIELNPTNAQYFSATFKYHGERQMKVGVMVFERKSQLETASK